MTDFARQLAEGITAHARAVIALLLILTVVIGAGVVFLEEDTSLEQFMGESEAAEASTFIQEHFTVEGTENQTTVQVIRRGEDDEDVFTQEAFIETLEFQQAIREHPDIAPTLPGPGEIPPGADPRLGTFTTTDMIGVGNVLALYELERVIPLDQVDDPEGIDFSGLDGVEDIDAVTLSELGINTFADIPGDVDGNVSDPFEAIEGVDTITEFNEEFESLGAVPLGRIRPDALGFTDVNSFPPPDCLVEFQRTDRLEPPLSCQIWIFEEMSDPAFEAAAATVLGPEGELDALALLPRSYDAGSTTAHTHGMQISQETDGEVVGAIGEYSENVTKAQHEIRTLGEEFDGEYLVFGLAMVTDEIDNSLDDSLLLISPLALLFVVVVLSIAYRDPLDILLGVGGILIVLLWTLGFMGWTGIEFNQLMIAVPVLLIGLSIDFAIHVIMRFRERKATHRDIHRAMAVALTGVGVALVWVTATTSIGFLSNLVSELQPLREFGVVSAFGVISALIVFTALLPAVKIELDEFLAGRGWDRERRAFGTGDTRVAGALSVGARAARNAPVAVLVVALLITAGGVFGATQIDTSFTEEDFLADEPPTWTTHLPGPMATGEYHVKEALQYIKANFQQVGREGELLVRGNVTDDEVLQWMDTLEDSVDEYDAIYILPNDQPDVRTPLTTMRQTAATNESFAQSYEQASIDGVPRENITALYDELLVRNPAGGSMVARGPDNEYHALRVQIAVDGEAPVEEAAYAVRGLGTEIEEISNGSLQVTASGDPVIYDIVESGLLDTVLQSLLITLVAVILFLTVAYRFTGGDGTLGVITILPVLFALTWILGTMWVLDIPFNALTGTITALTIGLGIDYNIHISDRYRQELREQEHVWGALHTTVTGTGGALLGTALTTMGGFGTLALTILPALQQFGIVTALTILYTFLGSIFVLPALLVHWTRYIGPAEYFESDDTAT